jgi:hypothetical protein
MAAADDALKIKEAADRFGWTVDVRGDLLTIRKYVANREEFVQADGEYYSVLSARPRTRSGSVWGTDGGGMGGMGAIGIMDGGTFVMNASGGSKRVLSALNKIL